MSLDLLALINEPSGDRETATDADGWVYDIASGEVINRLDADGFLVRDRFEVTDPESADWVLRVRSESEAEIAKINLQEAAFKRHCEARRKAQYQRLAWWDYKFSASLIAFARRQLTGKARTWRGAFGSVAFRKTQGTTKIVSEVEAVAFVKTYAPELVRVTESVNLKAIEAAREVAEKALGEVVDLGFVKTAGASETITIETGIEISGGKHDRAGSPQRG